MQATYDSSDRNDMLNAIRRNGPVCWIPTLRDKLATTFPGDSFDLTLLSLAIDGAVNMHRTGYPVGILPGMVHNGRDVYCTVSVRS